MSRRCSHSVRRCGGYSLMEMVVVVVTLSAFAAMAGRLMVWCLHEQNEAVASEQSLRAWDHALTLLQRDVWQATSIEVTGRTQVVLEGVEGGAVAWSYRAADGMLRRQQEGGDRLVMTMKTDSTVSFAVEKAQLVVTLDAAQADEPIVLVSQPLLVNTLGGKP